MVRTTLALVIILAAGAGCRDALPLNPEEDQVENRPAPTLMPTKQDAAGGLEDQPVEVPQEDDTVVKIETFDQIPEDYDYRLAEILSEPLADDVIVSFYIMAASRNPSSNYRWQLHKDGSLFEVAHSGEYPSEEITFDRPLPDTPSKILTEDEINELYSRLEQEKFFEQPALQRPAVSEGGAYVIVRARHNDSVHDVVYENIDGPFIEYLSYLAD